MAISNLPYQPSDSECGQTFTYHAHHLRVIKLVAELFHVAYRGGCQGLALLLLLARTDLLCWTWQSNTSQTPVRHQSQFATITTIYVILSHPIRYYYYYHQLKAYSPSGANQTHGQISGSDGYK